MTNPPALEEIPSELLEAIRVPLTSLWADAGYLVGRAINGERDFAVHAIKARCDEIERAVRAALTPLKAAEPMPELPEASHFEVLGHLYYDKDAAKNAAWLLSSTAGRSATIWNLYTESQVLAYAQSLAQTSESVQVKGADK